MGVEALCVCTIIEYKWSSIVPYLAAKHPLATSNKYRSVFSRDVYVHFFNDAASRVVTG